MRRRQERPVRHQQDAQTRHSSLLKTQIHRAMGLWWSPSAIGFPERPACTGRPPKENSKVSPAHWQKPEARTWKAVVVL